jgi:hypothetical protein
MSEQEVCREQRTNRDLRPPVRVAPHRAMRRGLREAAVEENSTIAPWMLVVKRFSWAVDNSLSEVCERAVKAASRAQRGRSNAERLDGADANFIIDVDGPPTDTQIQRPFYVCVRREIHGGNGSAKFDVAEVSDVLYLQRQRGVSDPSVAAG